MKTRGNINNLSYAYDTILQARNSNDLKQLLMKVKVGYTKAGLQLNIKTKVMTLMLTKEILNVKDFLYTIIQKALATKKSKD